MGSLLVPSSPKNKHTFDSQKQGPRKHRKEEKQRGTLTHKGKVALEEFSVRIKPGLGKPAVLVFTNYVVHNIGKKTRDHQDLHVITLPAVLKVCWNLLHTHKQSFKEANEAPVKAKCIFHLICTSLYIRVSLNEGLVFS